MTIYSPCVRFIGAMCRPAFLFVADGPVADVTDAAALSVRDNRKVRFDVICDAGQPEMEGESRAPFDSIVSSALESKGEKSSKLGPPIRALDNDVNFVKQYAQNTRVTEVEERS